MKKIPFEYKITITYIFIGALWILFSDQLVVSITTDPHRIQTLSTYKGWLYVAITGILLFILVRKEIQRRTTIHNQLLEAKRKAVEADNLKTAFLKNLSHYIRTPLNGILGFVDLLENKDTTPEKHQLFRNCINESSQHLLQTLNSIIEISKIQEGLSDVKNKEFAINELLNSLVVFANMETIRRNKPVFVNSSLALPDGKDTFISDRSKIYQILLSLLSNAINFTEQGQIEIGYNCSNNLLTFYVKDEGTGISTEKQKALFTDFMYNDSKKTQQGEGAGLGLHLSAKLAKLLGGKIWLESTHSTGSIFCLSIPGNIK